MKKALAMVEYKTVSSGMQAADIMVKTADVEIIEATKRVIINDLFKIIAENITCEIDDESANPTITARIFIGTEQGEE